MILGKHIEKKTDKYSVGSKEKLKASVRHKIRRTFVGCLDIIEKELMALGIDKDSDVFKTIRKKILSVGNDQVRNMEAELEKYNIEFIPYHITLPVLSPEELKKLEDGNGNKGV
jgi:hypothetical protein